MLKILAFFLCLQSVISAQNLIPLGRQQIFEFVNDVSVDHVEFPNTKNEASFKFQTNLQINSIWNKDDNQLLEIYFVDPKLMAMGQTRALEMRQKPFYVSLENGRPTKLFAFFQRDQTLINVERSIASLLFLQLGKSPVTEVDVSGRCTVFYNVKSSTKIEKTKTDCSHWDLRVRYRNEQALNVNRKSQQFTTYDLSSEGSLLRTETLEKHEFVLAAKPDIGQKVLSKMTLRHLSESDEVVSQVEYSSVDEIFKDIHEDYRLYEIEAEADGSLSEIKERNLTAVIVKKAENLKTENIGTKVAAKVLVDLLPLARITKKEEFVNILQGNVELHPQLMDLLGAVQTIEAQSAISEIFEYNNYAHWEMLEKYMQALVIGEQPERAVIADLLERLLNKENSIENEKLRDTLLQTISALISRSNLDGNDELVKQTRDHILSELEKCQQSACKVRYIRALQNLKDSSTLPNLLQLALNGEKAVSVASLQAIKAFPLEHFRQTDTYRKDFWRIFLQSQRKFDTTARTYALDMLLALKPSVEELGQLLDYLAGNDRNFEIKTFVIQKLRMLIEKCPRFRAMFNSALSTRPQVNNYHILAQKGLTTVLQRELSISPAMNESLLSVQEIQSGVLKRGVVDLVLKAGRDEVSTFKLGIFAEGLSSFVGENTDAVLVKDDEEEAESSVTAGMEISVQGIALRPLVFFDGQGELMGHVWSGTASEPMLAYLASVVEQDFEHYVLLSSGITVYITVLGGKSVDLNGRVELSLWNRNAQVEIQHNTGFVIAGKLITGWEKYLKLQQQFELSSEPSINLNTDVDFYSDIKLCMQLQRAETALNVEQNKTMEWYAEDRTAIRNVRRSVVHKSAGQTLALNQKNNEMCNSIFSE